MSDFFDNEAEVSEGSEDEEVREEIRRHKKVKTVARDDSDEEEEEDDDDIIAEEMKDLINDDVEEEGEDSEEEIGRVGKRVRDELDQDLEEDDYDLIEENLGRKIQRKKKFRRVRRLEDDEEEEEDRARGAKDAIASELFHDEDDEEEHERPVQRDRSDREAIDNRFAEIEESEESDEDNFIVDDNDQPIVNRQRTKKSERFTDQALQQAQEIFGVDFDYDEVNNYDENAELDEEDEEYGEGELPERVAKKKKKRSNKKSIFELYEPAELERSHLTEYDNEIRNTDLPERFQLRAVPVTPCLKDEELQKEADWIYKQLYCVPKLTFTNNNDTTIKSPLGGFKPAEVQANIYEVLHFLRNDCLEVPFIAYYRKEYYQPNLNIDDLWLIYRWDERWCQLQERKNNLLKLLENMREYQVAIIASSEDQTLPHDMRRVTERDVRRAQGIKSLEEFNDCYLHFQLHYSSYVLDMKKYIIQTTREERSRKRLAVREARRIAEENGEENGEPLPEEEEIEENDDDLDLTERMGFLKLAVRRDMYTICREYGVDMFAAKFGLTPEQFGEHLNEGYSRNEIEQLEMEPLDAAQEFLSKRFTSPEKVLEAAIFMVGRQIACDPLVRKTVRQVFYERARVNVKPTKKGQKEIDEAHPCYSIRYLKSKLVSTFGAEQFLQLTLAHKEGLVTMDISIDDRSHTSSYFDEIKHLYQRDEFSNHVQLWNAQRSEALTLALNQFLYPYLIKEITNKAIQESQFEIIQECCRKLYSYLNIAPLSVEFDEDDDDFSTRHGVRVLGLAFTPNNEEASYAVIIGGDGEVTDFLKLEFLMHKRMEGFMTDKDRMMRQQDLEKLKRFISSNKPHAIAVGCDTILTRDVVNDVKSIINDLNYPPIRVEYIDSEVALVYMNSKRAATDFYSYPLKLRKAISLARRFQDPLTEFAQLCTPDDEILCLKYHPLQDAVSRDELLNSLHQQFVSVVNGVGVDVNRCLVQPHRASLVQFIGGFGPRKGNFLLSTLKKCSTALLEVRTQLVQTCNIGKNVFINCSGFIKIDTDKLTETGTDTYIEVLDSTRVHPEAYEWARKMAVDALDYDDSDNNNPAQALEEIIQNPDKLRDLDLDEFAKELQRQGLGLKKDTLYDIRNELSDRYRDKRPQLEPPTLEQIFQILSGENCETMIGKLFLVRVTGVIWRKPKPDQVDKAQPVRNEQGNWVCCFCNKADFSQLNEVWTHLDSSDCRGEPQGVRVRLDNRLTGTIFNKYISDQEVSDPLTRVKIGMIIHCRVTRVQPDRFSVELTCRTSDLLDPHSRYKPQKDSDYDFEAEERDKRKEDDSKKRNTNQKSYRKRVIIHDSFRNIDFRTAERLLRESQQGKLIIRPSSKGDDHLTLSWKVHDDIHQHVDIREENKKNAFSLGHKLYIDAEEFEDLDEIVARYVSPMATYAREIIGFKYFADLNGDRTLAEKMLAEEKSKAPTRIPYYFSASKELPGKFLLSYQPNEKAFHEYVTVTPQGLKYRQKMFKSLDALLKWFKHHFNDFKTIPKASPASLTTPVNASPQAIQRAAAAMPNHVFNALSQVTTPSFNQPFGAQGALPIGAAAGSFVIPRPPLFPAQLYGAQRAGFAPVALMPPVLDNGRPVSRSGWRSRTPTLYPSTPGASSSMSISPAQQQTPRGDQTPLVDEWR